MRIAKCGCNLLYFQSIQTAIHRVLPQDNIEQEISTFNASSNSNRNAVAEGLNNLDVDSDADAIMTVPESPARSAFRNIYHSGKT